MYHPEKKFIFIHPPKCAGTSVREILRIEFESTQGGIYEPAPHWSLKEWANYIKHTHELTSFDIKEWFVFGVIRNPFDRVLSYHEHIIRQENPKSIFKEWVKTSLHNHYFRTHANFMNMFDYNKQLSCDYFIRQEDIENGVRGLTEKLNIQNYELKHIRHKTKRKESDYRKFYDNKTQQIIYDFFKDDIEYFGYEFAE